MVLASRTMAARSAHRPRPPASALDIGRQVPHHSDPATQRVSRSTPRVHKGLDLEGLPNLLGQRPRRAVLQRALVPPPGDQRQPAAVLHRRRAAISTRVCRSPIRPSRAARSADRPPGPRDHGSEGAAVVRNAAPTASRDTSAGAMAASAEFRRWRADHGVARRSEIVRARLRRAESADSDSSRHRAVLLRAVPSSVRPFADQAARA